jgi:phosphoribosylformylglycinamidine cyclo-ligase
MKYSDSGVDIERADQAKAHIRHLAKRTFTRGVLTEIGSFGAMFQMDRKRWREPVLVSSADGVGTKLKVAFAMNVHSTVGADIVNHCVNDILTQGAEPLFFLDYLALGKMHPAVVEQIIEGMSRACRVAGCALIGGETAEMPGFYPPGEYDLAGFIVGAVERSRVLDGKRVRAGDVLLALPSSGLHTNGYSLARKLLFEVKRHKPNDYVVEVGNKIGAELLTPHRCYWPLLKNVVAREWLSAMAHITGGGITENLPRVLPRGTVAQINLGAWPVPRIFRYLQQIGKIEQEEMLRTFNCGAGMILVIPPKHLPRVEAELKRRRERSYRIGHVLPASSGSAGHSRVSYAGALQGQDKDERR